ncbi:histidine kinase [Micromonospora polyrhachis]
MAVWRDIGGGLVRAGSRNRQERLFDVLLWAALSAPITWALLVPWPDLPTGLRLAGSLSLVGVAVVLSRRHPAVSLVLVVLPTIFDGNFVFGIPVMSYLLGLRAARARPAVWIFAVIALGGTVLNLGVLDLDVSSWFLIATVLLFAGVFPWLLGRYRRQHQALVLAGWEQADLLEREQRGAAERIRMRERARIAQDMHDSLGHDLSLIALRAGALELTPGLDERHRRAAGELRVSVAAATDRLRDIIGVLREDTGPSATRPADESIPDLVAGARDAGMSVQLVGQPPFDGPPAADPARERPATDLLLDGHPAVDPLLDGQPADDPLLAGPRSGGELSPMADRAAYRVVQEALTNAARYAPGAPVVVRVTGTGEWTEVSVRNEPPPAGPLPARASTGSGLLALRERVRLAGGTLSAGPCGGGFAVTARLPHGGVERVSGVDDEPLLDVAAPLLSSDAAFRMHHARRRVRRSLLVAVAVPLAIAAVLSLVYYPLATFNAVLEQRDFDRLRLGEQRVDLREVLPGRQVAAPTGEHLPVPPAGSVCEYYTDGNFPFAQPTYRLCFADGRLTAKHHLTG